MAELRQNQIANGVGMEFACRNLVEPAEFLDKDRIGEEFVDVAGAFDGFDIHNRQTVRALGKVAPEESFFPLGDIVNDILDHPEGFFLLAGMNVDDIDDEDGRLRLGDEMCGIRIHCGSFWKSGVIAAPTLDIEVEIADK
jgi:hypothetical protein